jgi:hypothetical protein
MSSGGCWPRSRRAVRSGPVRCSRSCMGPRRHQRPRTWIEPWLLTTRRRRRSSRREARSVTRGAPTRAYGPRDPNRPQDVAPPRFSAARRACVGRLPGVRGHRLRVYAAALLGSNGDRDGGDEERDRRSESDPTQGAATLPTLAPATPNGPQPVIAPVNRQVTSRVDTIVTLTHSGRARVRSRSGSGRRRRD